MIDNVKRGTHKNDRRGSFFCCVMTAHVTPSMIFPASLRLCIAIYFTTENCTQNIKNSNGDIEKQSRIYGSGESKLVSTEWTKRAE